MENQENQGKSRENICFPFPEMILKVVFAIRSFILFRYLWRLICEDLDICELNAVFG